MRVTFGISYCSGEDKLEPKFVCPVCSRIGLAFDPAVKSFESFSQRCLCCGYSDNPNYREDYAKNWREAWIECGSENLSGMPYEERRVHYSKIVYACYAKYHYVLSDEEIEKREFDGRLFTQYGFVNRTDSSKKISVRCDDGNAWKFDYKTNTIFCLDDERKIFAVGEEPDAGRFYLFAGEYLSEKSSGEREYRGGYIGFVPDLFGAYYSLDKELVLTDLEGKHYCFNIEKEEG